ncbi:dnaJ homolog subfamily C member 22-like isoform X1 [Toxorhynchites rutilus septentrionalis]|uniref:dnaJ homolog subfamily C member 22-like isoform X1 n=1 Tax=Toxorhynchites rutilus septentrionalis TaxID=329112 RepID=UPI00247B2772|nr:dnaJ homolog subfamily C member 22-like isoform X1 [Toxorhynchites rutilus septentrionalis]
MMAFWCKSRSYNMGEKISPSAVSTSARKSSNGVKGSAPKTSKDKSPRRKSKEEKLNQLFGEPPVDQPARERPKQKSVLVAYVLWLFGGFFGLHHLYLHQDRRAFIWWCTLGGYFGIGWLSEVHRIPAMVRDANEDPRFVEEFRERIRVHRKPPFSTSRFVLAIMVGYLFGQVMMIAIPQEVFAGVDWSFLHWSIPLGVAIGVWTVGNMGREKGVFWHSLVGAYISYPIRYFVLDEAYWFTTLAFCSAFAFDNFSKEWDLDVPKRKKPLRRAAILVPCVLLYLSLWGCFLYFNGTITDSEGDEVPVHEAIHNFIKSPWWTDLKQTVSDTIHFARHNGWTEVWKQIIDSMDVDGEQNAYKILGVSPTASQTEITSVWRKLSRENHPDKVKEESQRRAAQEKFMEIQQAYEVLSKIKSKRRQRNKKPNDDL